MEKSGLGLGSSGMMCGHLREPEVSVPVVLLPGGVASERVYSSSFPVLLARGFCWYLHRPPLANSCDSYLPTAMCEMIKIMQENGEVTCCLGSSANLRNSCLFLQSDVRSGEDTGTVGQPLFLRPWVDRPACGWGLALACTLGPASAGGGMGCSSLVANGYAQSWLLPLWSSIALDPLYPSRCSWETFGYATSTTMAQASDGLSPLQLSGQLNSLPCSLTFRQEETISIIRLIEQVGLR